MKINDIEIIIKKKNIKNMYLRVVPPNGDVTLSVPSHIGDEKIINFINSKMDWILEKKSLMKYVTPLKYINGEKHYLWGNPYTLQLIANNIKEAFFRENTIYLPVSKRSRMQNRQKTLEDFYRSEVKKEIASIHNKCTNMVGRSPIEIKIRKMKNWGNCRKNGIITLNLKLAMKPKICLEYVFIHELCHLIEFNHSRRFYELMDNYCPNWREIKKMLNE